MTPPVGETYQLSWKEFKSPQYDALPWWLKEEDIIRSISSSWLKVRTYLYKAKEDALVAYLNHPNRVASCDASAAGSVSLQQKLFLTVLVSQSIISHSLKYAPSHWVIFDSRLKNIAERKYPITMKIVYLWWNLPAAYPARTGKRSATTHLQKKWSHFTKSSALKPGDMMCCPTFASDNWPLETNVAKQDQRSRKCVITVYTSRGKERNKRERYTCVWIRC